MDFIEQWFHLSPDGGSGTFEACYAIAAGAGAIVLLQRALTVFLKRPASEHRRR
jgi:hypothetical protein